MVQILVFILSLFGLSYANYQFSQNPPTVAERQLLLPPANIEHFSMGYRDAVADSLWIRVIQDFDFCEKKKMVDKGTHLAYELIGTEKCREGWVYHMLEAITNLAPRFRIAYSAGGIMLSVVVDDSEGAANIFEKGLKNFPTDWVIAYRAGYHYVYEIKNPARAAELFAIAAQNGAPNWLQILSSRMYSKAGQAALAKTVLNDFIANNPDQAKNPHVLKRMKEIDEALAGENN